MRYGRLEVLSKHREAGRTYYDCICDCGTRKSVRADNVRSGFTASCGCLNKEASSARLKRLHGFLRDIQKSTINLPASSRV